MTMFTDNAVVHHATKAKAERLAETLAAEYPAITIAPVYEEDGIKVIGFTTEHTDAEGAVTPLTETKKVPELADILAACDDNDVDPEEGFEEDEGLSGSVVDVIYRQQYKESSSTGQSCGDWLAEWLVRTLDADGKLDEWAFAAIMSNNGVDMTAKWAQVATTRSPGWKGRYRMNGRQALDKRIALTGQLMDESGNQHEVPAEFLAHLRGKHAKWLAKEAKKAEREAAAADALAAE